MVSEYFKGLRNFTAKDGAQNSASNYVEGGWSPEAAKSEILQLENLLI